MTRLCRHFQAHQVLIGNSRHLIMVDAPQAVLAAIASPGGTR